MKQIIHNLYFEFFIITYRPIIYIWASTLPILFTTFYTQFFIRKNQIIYYTYNQWRRVFTSLAIDFESKPKIYNCSFGLAEPGTFVTQICFIFLIEVVAPPHTAS